jgi:hypothetical protein
MEDGSLGDGLRLLAAAGLVALAELGAGPVVESVNAIAGTDKAPSPWESQPTPVC